MDNLLENNTSFTPYNHLQNNPLRYIDPDGNWFWESKEIRNTIKVLKSYGYKVPDDCKVIGFSESSLADVVEPSLSTVAQPTIEMGRKTAELMLRLIESDVQIEPESILLNGKLVIRESSQIKNG